MVLQPKSMYGTFYSGDSYIVLNMCWQPGWSVLQWDVHFWLGRETTQDESGMVVYKTVELDDYLRGGPVEHREVQGHKSQLFQSNFPQGCRSWRVVWTRASTRCGRRSTARGCCT